MSKWAMGSAAQENTPLDRIIDSLEAIAGLDRIWTRGLVHRGGPHYRLRGSAGPVTIGEDECLLLGDLIAHFRPKTCFVIGNGFGLSSIYIATVMEANCGASVITLDSKTEGNGELCFRMAEQLCARMGCRILRNEQGYSPQDIEKTIPGDLLDLTLIDGDHSHPQATRDFLGVQRFIGEHGIVCWHDFWLAGVAKSVEEAQRHGYHCVKVNTSCEMVLGTKNERVYRELQSLFGATEAPRPRKRPLARMRVSGSFWWFTIRAALQRKS
jgi:predicted O-methyltransferase YrrM